MKKYLLNIIGLFSFLISINLDVNAQIIPDFTAHNENIVWESVFTDGSPGKVNRGIVDSDGNAIVLFMPESQSRIHKINGVSGDLIWSININNTVGFGVTEIYENSRCDYIISGGIGSTQERWVSRINGDNGETIWSQTYNSSGSSWMYDGVRMTIIGSDGFIYGAGFIGADEPGTIFVVYGGSAMLMKIDPATGNEIWTHTNTEVEYALSVVQASDDYLYYVSALYDGNLSLSKVNTNGEQQWINFIQNTEDVIPSDLTIDNSDILYFGGHTGRSGAGYPYDFTCIKMDTEANVDWIYHYANPRGYSLNYIRNELFGIKVNNQGVFLFGGSGDESNSYSETNPPYLSSDIWNGWVLQINPLGDIIRSDIYSHAGVNTATEYGVLINGGYVIFNDTDAFGDTEVGVMKIINSNINEVFGCTDGSALNFNSLATNDDGSCEYETQFEEGISVNLSVGWNMVGFSCENNINASLAIAPYEDNLIIMKNNLGSAYLPDWNFNGIGDLERGFGYQLKIYDSIIDFNLCNY